ncbi:hypothetical protein [Succinimonas amylolytica]|uniref:hypothetical protein n=1 Tax=Succinimonas amylolytica TaxID=83769 RepID=UPI0003698CAF|nr:hypothetical protein [Succinimonas amylolytica]
MSDFAEQLTGMQGRQHSENDQESDFCWNPEVRSYLNIHPDREDVARLRKSLEGPLRRVPQDLFQGDALKMSQKLQALYVSMHSFNEKMVREILTKKERQEQRECAFRMIVQENQEQ